MEALKELVEQSSKGLAGGKIQNTAATAVLCYVHHATRNTKRNGRPAGGKFVAEQ